MQIKSKREFFDLWEAGCLGNRPKLWRVPEDAFASGEPRIGFRELGKAGGGAWEIVPRAEVFQTAERWTREGRIFMMDSTAPDDRATLQGEVCRTFRGLEGVLAVRSGMSMRRAMAAGLLLPRTGATVIALMQQFMDPSSQEDVNALLELFPDATVEFSSYACDVGNLSGRNTLIWEVRDY